MDTKRTSFWEIDLLQQHYDLVVIGAGLTGLSSAYFFQKDHPNARVIILERGAIPSGASTRNAGFACIGSVSEILSDLKIDAKNQVLQRINDRYNGLLLLRKTLTDNAINYEHCGGWEIFTDADTFSTAKNSISSLNNSLENVLGVKDVFTVGTYNNFPAIFNKLEGMLHSGKMIHSLIQKCLQAGIEIRWNTEVSKLNRSNNQIETKQGVKFRYQNLIIATNAFTKTLLPSITINPGRGYIFVTKKLPELTWKSTFHFNKGYIYFRNLGDDRMLIGGARNIAEDDERTTIFGINNSIKNHLINFAKHTLQLPANFEIEYEWSGIMGFTPSKSYLIQKVDANTILAAGLSGMGVALGMNVGKKASDAIANNGN